MKNKNLARIACALVLSVGTILSLAHCGSKTATGASYTYAGSGSDWTWTLNGDGSFTASETSTSTSVNGSFQRLSTGFVKLTVTSASGTGAPAAGSQAYALEVPGVAMLVKPILASETQMITLVASGTCPTADFAANWIYTQHSATQSYTDATKEVFGTFAWTNATGSGNLPAKYSIAGSYASLGSGTAGSGTCAGGVMSIGGGGKMYLTSNGGAVVKLPSGGGGQGVLALPVQSISSAASLAGTYAGLLFDNSAGAGNKIKPLQGIVNAGGTSIAVNGLTDVSTGALDATTTGTVSIDAVNAPSAGFLEATVSATGTGKMACMTGVNVVGSGKNIIFCAGQSPGDNTKPFNVIFVSR